MYVTEGLHIRTIPFCVAAILFLTILLFVGMAVAENVSNKMTNETPASLNLFLSHYQKMQSSNFTWLGNDSLDIVKGNVAGGDVHAFKTELEKMGFTVQFGGLKIMNIYDLVDAGILFSCNGNNPNAPYKVYVLPPAPGQLVPNAFTDKNNMSPVYRLRPDEALVFIGMTPPECTYFSYQTFQYYHYYPVTELFRKTFCNVGDTINFRTIKTNGTEGNPFDKATIIVSTADKGADEHVRAAAKSAGYLPDIINTETLPSAVLRFGVDKYDDAFILLHRMYSFRDGQIGSAYMNNLSGIVLRITPNESALINSYPMQELRVRETGNGSELDLTPALNDLRQAILDKYGSENATELVTSLWFTEGYDAMQRGVNILGAGRDAAYLNTSTFVLRDDPNDFLIVYGVNHAASGKALYSNLGIYGSKFDNGVVAVNNNLFEGTAEKYLPANPAAKYLYVWKIARHCNNESNCSEVPWGQKSRGIELNDTAYMGFRAYVQNETDVGPSHTELAYDRVIKFGPRN